MTVHLQYIHIHAYIHVLLTLQNTYICEFFLNELFINLNNVVLVLIIFYLCFDSFFMIQ